MRASLALIFILALFGLGLAAPQMQSTGGDFGKSWLAQNANKFAAAPSSNNSNDLWSWGSRPRGYDVVGGQLYPIIAPAQTYYPMFMANATPIILNATSPGGNDNYISSELMGQDFMSPYYLYPYYASDPWFLAQVTEQPVIVRYPANTKGSRLL